MHPREIIITEGGSALVIEWADRTVSRIPGRSLRNACRCSRCLADRRGSHVGAVSLSLLQEGAARIVSVDLPSSSRISVGWGDLHGSSYYRFSELIELFPPVGEGTDMDR